MPPLKVCCRQPGDIQYHICHPQTCREAYLITNFRRMFNEYYLLENGEKTGPFTTQELMKMDLEIRSQIQTPSSDTWQDASDLPEFFEYFDSRGYYFPTEDNLASFWSRLLAYVIDSFILAICISLFASEQLMKLATTVLDRSQNPQAEIERLKFNGLLFLLLALYNTLCEATPMRGSIGKKLCRIVVVDADGQRLSVGRALLRNFSKIASSLAFGIGYLNILWNGRRQGWHDMIAKTYVIKREL